MTLMEAVVKRINEVNSGLGMSCGRLAEASGLPVTTLRDILSGKNRDVRIETVSRIANGLDMSLREFFDSDIFDEIDN